MDHFDEIAKYVNGDLTPQERQAFEQAMAKDEQLVMDVEVYRFENDMFDWKRKEDLRSKIRAYRQDFHEKGEKDHSPTGNKPPVKMFRLLSVAATVLLLLGCFYWLVVQPAWFADHKAIAGTFYNPSFPVLRSESPVHSTKDIEQQIKWLEQGKPQTPITFFEQIDPDDPLYLQAQYLLGHAYYQDGQYLKAAAAFRLCIQNPKADQRTIQDAEFHLLLTLLAADHITEAQSLAQQIAADKTHGYQPQVLKLLSKVPALKG